MVIRTGLSHINHLPRYREVANVLIKHGFGFIFDRFTLIRLRRNDASNRIPKDWRAPNIARRLRLAFEELGPTFVKLGQLLSVRPDILGAAFVKELEKLQNDVPAFPYSEVVRIFQEEGLELEEFAYFCENPIAAASMAQVHEAVLTTGEKVVVKVQRPGIDRTVEIDLEILYELSRMLEKRTSWGRLYKVSEIVDELGEALRNELDFQREARNADTFYRNFKNNPDVIIPRVYWAESSRRILTLEYVSGIKISDFINLKKEDFNTKRIASNLIDALFKQIYDYGFFHADPHPGNIAITSGEKIIFYDFGQVGIVDDLLRERCMNLLIGMMRYDTNSVTRSLLDLGIGSQYVNREEFRRDVARLQQKYYGLPLSEINVGEALSELIELSVKYQMRLPAELSLMVKMMMTVENIVSQLDPQLSIVDMAEPYGRKLLLKRLAPERLADNLRDMVLDYASVARSVPREIDSILKMLEEGELKIRMEHANLHRLSSRLDIMSNRLSVAIILASIIIGTSLVVDKAASGILNRIPLVEVGFLIALILGLFLVYSIIRSGRY